MAGRHIPRPEWEGHKGEIAHVYFEKGFALKDVQAFMRNKYNFDPTLIQYERQFKRWQFEKPLKSTPQAARGRDKTPDKANSDITYYSSPDTCGTGELSQSQVLDPTDRHSNESRVLEGQHQTGFFKEEDHSFPEESLARSVFHQREAGDRTTTRTDASKRNLTTGGSNKEESVFVAVSESPVDRDHACERLPSIAEILQYSPPPTLNPVAVAKKRDSQGSQRGSATNGPSMTLNSVSEEPEQGTVDQLFGGTSFTHPEPFLFAFPRHEICSSDKNDATVQLAEGKTANSSEQAASDSGYASIRPLDVPFPQVDNETQPSQHVSQDDNCTVYSDGTSVAPTLADSYIKALCKELANQIRCGLNLKQLESMGTEDRLIVALVKSFAIKLSLCSGDQKDRDIMYFVHKKAPHIAAKLTSMLASVTREDSSDSDDEMVQKRDEGMSFAERVALLWGETSSRASPSPLELSTYFDGISDELDDTDLPELAEYQKRVLASPAYQWLLSAISLRATITTGAKHHSTSTAVETVLRTGIISKSRQPETRNFSFLVDLSAFRGLQPRTTNITKANLIIKQRQQEQITTVSAYIQQMWPWTATQTIALLAQLSNPGEVITAQLQDGTRMNIWRDQSMLEFKVRGAINSIKECGDLITCIAPTLFVSPGDFSIEVYAQVDSVDASHGNCRISYKTHARALERSVEKAWHSTLGYPLVIHDFNMNTRSGNFPATELLYDHLESFVGSPCIVVLYEDQTFLKGATSSLQLIFRDDHNFIWSLSDANLELDECEGQAQGETFSLRHPGSRHFIDDGQQDSPRSISVLSGSDILSASSVRTVDQFNATGSGWHAIYPRVAAQLLAGFFRRPGAASESSSAPSRATTVVASTSGISSQDTGSNNNKKRGRGKASGDDNDNDEDGPREPPNKRSKLSDPPETKRFACPFWKSDPLKYRNCFKYKISRFRDVRQHLDRYHSPPYCQRCLISFPGKAELAQHLELPCAREAGFSLNSLSHDQQRDILRNNNRKDSEVQKWFAIWDIVFPGQPRPPSAYIDPGIFSDLCRFEQHALAEGPRLIAEAIQSHDAWTATDMPSAERDAHLQRIVGECLPDIFDRWYARRTSGDSTERSRRSERLASPAPRPLIRQVSQHVDESLRYVAHTRDAEVEPVELEASSPRRVDTADPIANEDRVFAEDLLFTGDLGVPDEIPIDFGFLQEDWSYPGASSQLEHHREQEREYEFDWQV